MKKFYFILLFTSICYCQDINYKRFSIENKQIVWQNIYQKDSIQNIEALKKNLNLVFTNLNSGYSKNQKLRCSGIAIYMMDIFQFNFQIEEKENKYRIRISNIAFNDNIELNLGSVQTTNKINLLEDFELKTKDYKFRKNSQSKKNMECLDQYLLELINTSVIDKW